MAKRWRQQLNVAAKELKAKAHKIPSKDDAQRLIDFYCDSFLMDEEEMTFSEAEKVSCQIKQVFSAYQKVYNGLLVPDWVKN